MCDLHVYKKEAIMSQCEALEQKPQFLIETPRGRTVTVPFQRLREASTSYDSFISCLMEEAIERDLDEGLSTRNIDLDQNERSGDLIYDGCAVKEKKKQMLRKVFDSRDVFVVHQGKIIERSSTSGSGIINDFVLENELSSLMPSPIYLSLRFRGRGGIDRQNRVGSKFGGGGVSSAQQAERERKERLKKLALESIDLAKDPYLMRNHLGTYECKLCLTLHTNEANYLAHTQGKKHQQGLARRAHMEKLRQEQQQQSGTGAVGALSQQASQQQQVQMKPRRVRIGRPAYQVFKSRDADSNQRCLSFELQYPEIEEDIQPQFRFMSAFEQRVESPPDRRYQYLLFAAEPYETVSFKIPNEPIDKGEDRFVTHWDSEDKKFTLTLYFLESNTHEQGGVEHGNEDVQGNQS